MWRRIPYRETNHEPGLATCSIFFGLITLRLQCRGVRGRAAHRTPSNRQLPKKLFLPVFLGSFGNATRRFPLSIGEGNTI